MKTKTAPQAAVKSAETQKTEQRSSEHLKAQPGDSWEIRLLLEEGERLRQLSAKHALNANITAAAACAEMAHSYVLSANHLRVKLQGMLSETPVLKQYKAHNAAQLAAVAKNAAYIVKLEAALKKHKIRLPKI